MSQSTTALLLPEVGASFELREVFLAPLQPDEVLVEIRATGLCHTDLSFANGTLPCSPNAVLGHEGQLNSLRLFTCDPPLARALPIKQTPSPGWIYLQD